MLRNQEKLSGTISRQVPGRRVFKDLQLRKALFRLNSPQKVLSGRLSDQRQHQTLPV